MNKNEEIKESIEFCKDIYIYYEPQEQDKHYYMEYPAYRKEIPPVGIPAEHFETEDSVDETKVPVQEKSAEYQEYKRQFLHVLLCIVLAFAAAKLVSSKLIQITTVHGDSMEATVSDGDRLLVDKINYRFEEPKRFDVIVFTKDGEVNLIKRVIGLPEEKVEIKDGIIYIDGIELEEQYGLDPMNPEAEPVEMQLGEDEYFVLGDNRLVSLDSRYPSVSAIEKDEIIGKAIVRIFPLNRMRSLTEKNNDGE